MEKEFLLPNEGGVCMRRALSIGKMVFYPYRNGSI